MPSHPTVALTGATGFVGRHTLAALLARGWRVRILLRGRAGPPPGDSLEVIHGALDQPRSLHQLVTGANAVIHLAGAIRGAGYRDFSAVNVSGTGNLVAAIERYAPRAHLIHVSSLAARTPQLSWYAKSKRAGEELVLASGLNCTLLRPPAVYGPDDAALAPLWRALARGWLLQLGPAHARFSLVHVDDLAAALVRTAAMARGSGTALTLHDGTEGGYDWPMLAATAAHQRGGRVRRIRLAGALLRPVCALNLSVARLSGRQPLLTPGKLRELVHDDWVCDNKALSAYLGWTPGIRLEDRLTTLPGWNQN